MAFWGITTSSRLTYLRNTKHCEVVYFTYEWWWRNICWYVSVLSKVTLHNNYSLPFWCWRSNLLMDHASTLNLFTSLNSLTFIFLWAFSMCGFIWKMWCLQLLSFDESTSFSYCIWKTKCSPWDASLNHLELYSKV